MYTSYWGVSTLNNSLDSCISPKTPLATALISLDNSINYIMTNSQINQTIIGIVARENPSKPSGYEVADHLSNADTLVKYNTETGEKGYVHIDLGEQRPEDTPGINLVNLVNRDHPDLKYILTPQPLKTEYTGVRLKNAKNRTVPKEKDIDKVIEEDIKDIIADYEVESEESEATNNYEVIEYDADGGYIILEDSENELEAMAAENESGESPDAELVAAEREPEGDAPETAE